MQRSVLLGLILLVLPAFPAPAAAQRNMERLSRGVVAVRTADGSVFVGWRLLGNDAEGTAFNVYRQAGEGPMALVNPEPATGATNLVDKDAPREAAVNYIVRAVVDGKELEPSAPVAAWDQNYLEFPIQRMEGYRPGDASVGDLDGDGQLDIVLHQTSRGQDNSFAGVTGQPVLDGYKLDGTHLWRINLGKNIREGEHYTQFMVYDLDSDGRAEVVCKTADGTVDGQGQVIGDAEKDWRTMRPGSRRDGRILDGPEFLTVFDGLTGAALETVDYIPSRYPIDGWGGIGGNAGNDDYGNRCDRFLACVAYLDGQRPSVVMCRGVYGRIVMAAWDWRGGELSVRWVFDTGMSYPPYENRSPFAGMGGHSLSVADVDADGKDEIVYQAMVVDDNGKGLYSSGLRHGDAMFVTDMDPERPGMEIFSVQENEEHAEEFQTPGAAMRDARTGEILWSHSPAVDIGGGMAADVDPTHSGFEAWGGPGGLRNAKGETIGAAPRETGWTVWWDGDPLRELVTASRGGGGRGRFGRRPGGQGGGAGTAEAPSADGAPQRPAGRFGGRGSAIAKWNWEDGAAENIATLEGSAAGRGPCLLGDLLGDWREELLLVSPDGGGLRLFTTTIPTDLRLTTLLHDPQYRLGLAWQNVVYNKPCYPSFYLGHGMKMSPRPSIRIVGEDVAPPANATEGER
jgi:rhamnogalacturonan endolyase